MDAIPMVREFWDRLFKTAYFSLDESKMEAAKETAPLEKLVQLRSDLLCVFFMGEKIGSLSCI